MDSRQEDRPLIATRGIINQCRCELICRYIIINNLVHLLTEILLCKIFPNFHNGVRKEFDTFLQIIKQELPGMVRILIYTMRKNHVCLV